MFLYSSVSSFACADIPAPHRQHGEDSQSPKHTISEYSTYPKNKYIQISKFDFRKFDVCFGNCVFRKVSSLWDFESQRLRVSEILSFGYFECPPRAHAFHSKPSAWGNCSRLPFLAIAPNSGLDIRHVNSQCPRGSCGG